MAKFKFEYIWLDGYKPDPSLRSKTKVLEFDSYDGDVDALPEWSFDGSSTQQAEGRSSDCLLKPVAIVSSKTFTTIETMTNADSAKRWMAEKVANPGAQFAAVSTAADKTAAYGIDPSRVFGFEDRVGGRYSMWGPIGLSLMIAIGPEAFDDFLAGGRDMDERFLWAPFEENMPVSAGACRHLAQPDLRPRHPRGPAL